MSAGRLFPAFAAVLFVFAAAFASFGNAAEYEHTVRLGPDTVVIPQNAAEAKRLFGDEYRYRNQGHLVLISDLDQGTLTRLEMQDFEAFLTMLTRQLFNKAMNSYRKNNPLMPVIFLFKDRNSYTKGMRDMGLGGLLDSELERGNLRRGYQFNASGVNGVLIDYRDNYAHGLSIYAHELTHALIGMEYPGAPIWLNEGLATMFGHSRVAGGQLEYAYGDSFARMKQRIKAGRALPLARLFKSTNADFLGGDHLPYYDAAELFCRYLQSRDLLALVYLEMRDGRGKGVNGSETVARVVGRTPGEMEKDWHAWIMEQGGR